MAGDGVNWDGLLKWSIANSDGTRSARQLSEEDRKWFMEAMQAQTIDVVKRMKEITQVIQTPEDVLKSQGVTSADIEGLLDELQEHVESIDMANDLHTIGGLGPLLAYLNNTNAGIRAKAADVVTTIVQNNPKSQQLVMEANGMQPLMSTFVSDSDVTVRAKALGAISFLIRHNKPGINAFKLANGYEQLKEALKSENIRFQRKALNLVQYLLHENSADCAIARELGYPRLMVQLASSDDIDVREAALRGLLELSKDQSAESDDVILSVDSGNLKTVLQKRIDKISSMGSDDLDAVKEERYLVDKLWSACYKEPSSLREKELVVRPGEDEPSLPLDVASKLFEPPLRRAFASAKPEVKASNEKKETPLLLGPPAMSE